MYNWSRDNSEYYIALLYKLVSRYLDTSVYNIVYTATVSRDLDTSVYKIVIHWYPGTWIAVCTKLYTLGTIRS